MTPVTHERWDKCHRIVSSRFPPVSIFEEVADPADLEGVYWVEGLTNPRLREELGDLTLVAPEDRVAGPGTTPIMAAFTHLNPSGSRFSDGSYGVYYGARCANTAIAETVYHVERWAKESRDPATTFTMRQYIGELIERPYHDIRGQRAAHPGLFQSDPARYGPAQAFGAALRAQRSWGLLYDSVRFSDGECVAVFRPTALGPVRQTRHLAYVWDGTRIVDTQVIRSLGVPGRR